MSQVCNENESSTYNSIFLHHKKAFYVSLIFLTVFLAPNVFQASLSKFLKGSSIVRVHGMAAKQENRSIPRLNISKWKGWQTNGVTNCLVT